ncbi:hypothetical protein RND81_07G075500 [Saponaria officinalis]|uniref:SAUR-like auxin-responsive protein family n=1 Tax=Saponaria officinalis TaxID=3572 RepID=A0AAW1JQ13_SAPOF
MAKDGKFKNLMNKFSLGKTSRQNKTSLKSNISISDTVSSTTLHPVYVGKSRRLFLVVTDLVNNPIFQRLTVGGDGEEITVGCEVVLFEHLLWMLKNADPQPVTLDELVEFYVC